MRGEEGGAGEKEEKGVFSTVYLSNTRVQFLLLSPLFGKGRKKYF